MLQTPKLLTNILLGIITLVIIVSCSQLNQEQLTTSDSQSQFKVASILPGSIKKDDSWSQASYEGLKLIEKQYNAEINYTENVPDTDVEASIRRYAQQGYNLIIGHIAILNDFLYISILMNFGKIKFMFLSKKLEQKFDNLKRPA
ncbi:Basic membrane lipoprotein [Planktothrix rubescens]|nr:Basic membrane lipoprotein [Planktothrix rubescens]